MHLRPATPFRPSWALVLAPLMALPLPAFGAPPEAASAAETGGEAPPRPPKRPRPQPGAVVEVVGVAAPVVQETRLDPVAGPVTTITAQQIEDLEAQDLPAALRRLPGVVVSRHNPVGSFGGGEGGSVFLRGMGISRPGAEIQILMDGVPRAVGVWTHPLMDMLSVDVMETVEVHKGAQPVLFGHSAFGAVSITTKAMADQGFRSALEVAGGSYRTGVEVLQHGGKRGPLDYYLVQSYRASNGHRENAGGRLQSGFGRVGFAFSEHWRAALVLNATDNWADDPGSVDGAVPRQGRFTTGGLFAVLTVVHDHAGGEGHVKVYRDEGRIRWGGQYNATTQKQDVETNTDWDNHGVRLKESLKPWRGGELLLGADLDFVGGKVENLVPPSPPNRFPHTTFRILAPYLALSHTFGSRDRAYLIPSVGVRVLDHSEFGRATGSQAGLTGGYGDTEFHVAFARGLNYPGVYVKAQDVMFMPGDNRWKDLRPETVEHLEAGAARRFGKVARVELALFRDEGKDRIVTAPPPPFPPVFANLGTWRTAGLEISATWTPHRDLALFTSGTYLDATPGDLPYAPRRSGSLGGNWRFRERFQVSADLLYVDRQTVTSRARTKGTVNREEVGAYALVNAKLTWDLLRRTAWIGQVFLSLENLGNRTYEQKKGYPMPGLNGLAGLKVAF